MDSESEDAEDRMTENEGTAGDRMESTKELNDQKNELSEEILKVVQIKHSDHKNPIRTVDTLSTVEAVERFTESGHSDGVIPVSRVFCNSNSIEESKMSYPVLSDGKEENSFLPLVNTPEKIILCLDLSEDQFYMTSKFNEINSISSLNVIKQAIELFIHSKHMIDKRHQFALVVVHQKAVWLQHFTNKPKDILAVLSELTETPPTASFCLSSLFDVIKENVTLPLVEDSNIPPPYVIRAIVIYSRFQCTPKFYDGKESFHALMSSKYFSFDYIVVHESLSPEIHVSDEIANAFSEMDTKPYSLKFHISRSATKFLDSMARLLSHPLQRYTSYDLITSGDKNEILDSNGLQ